MSITRHTANCIASVEAESTADLHYQLGKLCEERPGVIARPEPEARPWDSNVRVFEGLALDCVVRPVHAPPAPDTERVRAIRADMEETERLMGAAWQRFREHGSRGRYRADCQRIVNRDEYRSALAVETMEAGNG